MTERKKITYPALTSKVNTNIKPRRPTSVASTSSKLQSAVKPRPSTSSRPKVNKNASVISEKDMTIANNDGSSEFEDEYRNIAYGKLLRAMLEDCLINEKIQREETEMDVQMAQLAMRFEKTIEHLDKTNRRIKDLNFIAQHKSLITEKTKTQDEINSKLKQSNTKSILTDITEKSQASLDELYTKNIDFGYNKADGFSELNSAISDAITGLDDIKSHYKLNTTLSEYTDLQTNIKEIEKDRSNLSELKAEFAAKYGVVSDDLMKEISNKMLDFANDSEVPVCSDNFD